MFEFFKKTSSQRRKIKKVRFSNFIKANERWTGRTGRRIDRETQQCECQKLHPWLNENELVLFSDFATPSNFFILIWFSWCITLLILSSFQWDYHILPSFVWWTILLFHIILKFNYILQKTCYNYVAFCFFEG